MKVVFLVALFAAVALAAPSDDEEENRGCRYILGRCVERCPPGTRGYHSACRAPTWSERTCDNPEKVDMGPICDLSRCDCVEPTVKDKTTGKCVKLEDCPKKATTTTADAGADS